VAVKASSDLATLCGGRFRIHNIPLTRKIREIEKMCMEILAIVCSAAGHK
jgi:hypothetical protein